MWYVLTGHFRFIADGELLDAPRGAFAFVPRGTDHCFQNIDDAPAHMLVISRRRAWSFFGLHAQLPKGPTDPLAYREIADRCWMGVTGVPLAQSHPS